MSSKRKMKIYLWISIICFLFMSISFLFMPLEKKAIQVMAGLMFWILLILGIVSQVILETLFRKTCFENKEWRVRKQRVGIFAIGKNMFAKIADVVWLISMVTFIGLMAFTRGSGYICYITLMLFVFAFSMHCILNGKIYSYIYDRNKKEKRKVEKKNDK